MLLDIYLKVNRQAAARCMGNLDLPPRNSAVCHVKSSQCLVSAKLMPPLSVEFMVQAPQ